MTQLNRFFVSPDFSVYFRRAKQLVWQNQATTGYSLLTTLRGKLDYTVHDKRDTLEQSESVVLDPNTSIIAKGQFWSHSKPEIRPRERSDFRCER